MVIVAEACQSFAFDNDAFTVWKKGGQVDVEGYTRWVDDWHRPPGVDWVLIPDVMETRTPTTVCSNNGLTICRACPSGTCMSRSSA